MKNCDKIIYTFWDLADYYLFIILLTILGILIYIIKFIITKNHSIYKEGKIKK